MKRILISLLLIAACKTAQPREYQDGCAKAEMTKDQVIEQCGKPVSDIDFTVALVDQEPYARTNMKYNDRFGNRIMVKLKNDRVFAIDINPVY